MADGSVAETTFVFFTSLKCKIFSKSESGMRRRIKYDLYS